ncbi:hypothetical protein [Microtetraspora malaysiensis]|uniref:DUF1360 domain-containing protein n=1 Tax=Microtetraspora malaysiensis TaxID=161358 RepID=A0ABW6SKG1_9ACTN
MPMSITAFLLALALIFRVTRFVTADALAEPFRLWVERRYGEESRRAYLVSCAWCASIWASIVIVPAAYVWGDTVWFQLVALIAAASYLYGLAATNLDNH